jgi:hypothetical protein
VEEKNFDEGLFKEGSIPKNKMQKTLKNFLGMK